MKVKTTDTIETEGDECLYTRKAFIGVVLIFIAITVCGYPDAWSSDNSGRESSSGYLASYTGSRSCRECHEKSYLLLATSRHGLAMQLYTAEFAKRELIPHKQEIVIGEYRYKADIAGSKGWVVERGLKRKKRYRIEYVLGGKNVYYFLTPFERRRLQVLPVAYDVRKKQWYDTAASGIRHFPDHTGEAIDWRDYRYTFNTSCYSCHVSQLETNYDLETDTYYTTWTEPGINCETCHGPSREHVLVCKATPKGKIPEDLKIILTKKFNIEQRNALCASCHAKMIPLTTRYIPGDQYFEYFDLVTLEDMDFYPDGRDLGENFTYTAWLMNPCIKSGKLSCLHCHNFDGRYRFQEEEKSNDACMPCHEKLIKNPTSHSHHKTNSPGNKCISCHMPMTKFARMRRSDHSLLPPAPSATLQFQSPNACNLCHTDNDAAWADGWVRKWWKRDYQAIILYCARLIDDARKRNWSRLPEMLSYMKDTKNNDIYRTSLVRLLRSLHDERKWPVYLQLLTDPSPLVRASAAEALSDRLTPEVITALVAATADTTRLVRIRTAAALSAVPQGMIPEKDRKNYARAHEEFLASLSARPDDWASHYNLGNYYTARNEIERAIASHETALRLNPGAVLPLTNLAILYSMEGLNDKAEASLRNALAIEPRNAAASFNMGLLLAEQGRREEAETALRTALDIDPQLAPAAYNLGVMLAQDHIEEAVELCRKASELRPDEPKYAFSHAFYLHQKGDGENAVAVLQVIIEHHPAYADAYLLLGEIYENTGKIDKAQAIYRQALDVKEFSQLDRYRFQEKLRFSESKEKK